MAIEAARAIVVTEGVERLTARRVARTMGYTVGTLYLVFRNLDDLIVHLNVTTIARLRAALVAAPGRRRTPKARLAAMMRAYAVFALDNPALWRLVFEHRLPAGQPAPGRLARETAAIFDAVSNELEPLVPPSARSRVPQVATALWGGVHGICMLSLTGKIAAGGVGETPQKQVATLVDLVVAGLDRDSGQR